jgi:membrane protein DedA with SNARE-associated domain
MLAALLIALSTLASEDLTCIGTGILIAQHRVDLLTGIAGCTLGIFLGDVLLVVAGRYATLLRIKTPALDILNRHTGRVLVMTRFTPGLRLPTYIGAGLLKLPMRDVVPPLAIGSALWTPLLVGLAAVFGAAFATNALRALELFVVCAAGWHVLRSYDRRRRILAFLHRLFRWEFWPSWAVYLPVIPYLLWLGLKHRSLTLFTASNPGIATGGLVGESKSAILSHLAEAQSFAARFELVRTAEDVQEFMERCTLRFPVVLKPDAGERGSGVAIVRSETEVRDYFAQCSTKVIAQEHVAGEEFGVFYCRTPGEDRGRITSITHKRLPSITGDGLRTIRELILADRRAFILHKAYTAALKRPATDVLERGERVQLVEVGSHCRGAVFNDATRLTTPELERAIDQVSKVHPGFYFGRFDVRAESIDALQHGRFKVLELNGVGAEATHIYDPDVSLWDAYRTIFRQWRIAYQIGAANRRAGATPSTLRQIWRAAQLRHESGPGGRRVQGLCPRLARLRPLSADLINREPGV